MNRELPWVVISGAAAPDALGRGADALTLRRRRWHRVRVRRDPPPADAA